MMWELAQIQAMGPGWKEMAIAGELTEGEAAIGGEGGGIGGDVAGAIPEFGGGPADVGGEEIDVTAETETEVEEPTA